MVSSYLVHHGYCATATAFARATETMIQEDQTSIKNRQSELTNQHIFISPVANNTYKSYNGIKESSGLGQNTDWMYVKYPIHLKEIKVQK